MKTIVADLGKRNTKAICLENGIVTGSLLMPSLTEEILDIRGEEFSGKSFIVNYGNEIYKVGECCKTLYNFDDNKMNKHSLILLNAVLYTLLDDADSVNIYACCPSDCYTSSADDFAEYLKQGGIIKSSCLDQNMKFEDKIISIENVYPYPEGMCFGPRFLNRNIKMLHVIDIGAYDINYRYYVNGNTKDVFSLGKSGTNLLVTQFKRNLSRNLTDNTNIDSLDLESIIMNRNLIANVNNSRVLDYTVKKFVNEEILNKLQSNGVNIKKKGIPVLFSGGGSQTLKEYLKQEIPIPEDELIFSKTFLWDNVISGGGKAILTEKPPMYKEKVKALAEGDFIG